jgi:hypothetical protein
MDNVEIQTQEGQINTNKPELTWDLKSIKKNKKVILLGTANSLKITPWDKDEYDYWACAPVTTYKEAEGHRIDVLFEMHHMEYWLTITDRLNEIIDKHPNTTLLMQQEVPQIKNSKAYPLKEVQEFASHPKLRNYFTSTISYMIALAIYLGYEEMDLYGIHMAAEEEEYSLQRSCCEAWLNFGLGHGVGYWLPDESSIMSCDHLYGYEQNKGVLLELMHFQEGFQNGVNELEAKLEKLKEEVWTQKGAVLGIKQVVKKFKK